MQHGQSAALVSQHVPQALPLTAAAKPNSGLSPSVLYLSGHFLLCFLAYVFVFPKAANAIEL